MSQRADHTTALPSGAAPGRRKYFGWSSYYSWRSKVPCLCGLRRGLEIGRRKLRVVFGICASRRAGVGVRAGPGLFWWVGLWVILSPLAARPKAPASPNEIPGSKPPTVVLVVSIWVSQKEEPLKMSGRLNLETTTCQGKSLNNEQFSRAVRPDRAGVFLSNMPRGEECKTVSILRFLGREGKKSNGLRRFGRKILTVWVRSPKMRPERAVVLLPSSVQTAGGHSGRFQFLTHTTTPATRRRWVVSR